MKLRSGDRTPGRSRKASAAPAGSSRARRAGSGLTYESRWRDDPRLPRSTTTHLRRTGALATATALLLAGCLTGTAAAALQGSQTLLLDTYEAPTGPDAAAGPVATSDVLASGGFYVVTASGTYSAYIPALMAGTFRGFVLCGAPEAAPTTPSPGRPASRVGQDVESIFSQPQRGSCTVPVPQHKTTFEMDLGSGFGHPQFREGHAAAPRTDHTYSALVSGQGSRASFRQRDTNTTDNNGVLTIVVRSATDADCGTDAACLAASPPGTAASAQSVSEQAASREASQLGLPSARRCLSRRRFPIRIRDRSANPAIRGTVRYEGRQVVTRGVRVGGRKRQVATIDLRGMPKQRVRVELVARFRRGEVRRGARRYRLCAPKVPSGPPEL